VLTGVHGGAAGGRVRRCPGPVPAKLPPLPRHRRPVCAQVAVWADEQKAQQFRSPGSMNLFRVQVHDAHSGTLSFSLNSFRVHATDLPNLADWVTC
jgi:hypothetical protein